MIYIDQNLNIPLYQQIYEGIKQEIILKTRREGEKMPSIRSLGRMLGVSVSTVVQAYDQLVAEGYLLNKKGSGHYVNHLEMPAASPAVQLEKIHTVEETKQEYLYSFARRVTDLRQFPLKKFQKIMNQSIQSIMGNAVSLDYKNGILPELQEAMAHNLNIFRGVNCRPEQVHVASAGHHLMNVIVRILYMKYDIRTILMEDPCQDYLTRVFADCGLDVIPIPMTDEGIDLEIVEQYENCAVLVTPGNQFPTGVSMPIQNRIRLLNWAAEHNSFILEDDRLGALSYRIKPMFSIQGLGTTERVIYMSSANYSVSPDLRFCFCVFPTVWVSYYDELYKGYPGQVPLFLQKAIALMIQEGVIEAYEKRVLRSFQRKREVFVKRLREEVRGAVTVCDSDGGVSVVVQANGNWTERELLKRAADQGVEVQAVSEYWHKKDKYTWNQVLLSFTSLTEEELKQAAILLGKAWRNE